MDLKEEFSFLHKLGLSVAVFGKHLKKSYRSPRELILFIIVTRLVGDELCYQDTLPEGELNRLRNWIRYGDLTGLAAEWRELDVIGYKVKTYLAGENPGIDCSAVMDEMFLNEDGKNYTYTLSKETRRIVRISHPQEEISLREHSGRVWRATKNFSDLITLNRKFLLGQIPETPYHRGQIDEETIPLVPGLLKLHDFGLFTISSQPYNHEVDKNCNKLREWQQKPCVSFVVSGKDVSYLEFFKKLKERADIVVAAQELCPFRIVDGSHSLHKVTRVRTADNNKDLEIAEWKCYGSVCSNNDRSFLVSKYFPAMEQGKPVFFDVAVSKWGVQLNVLDVIEEVVSGLDRPLMS